MLRSLSPANSIGLGAPRAASGLLLRTAAEIALLVLCLLPGMYFSYAALQEPWTMFRIARANISLEGGQIADFVTSAAGYRGEHIGGELIQVALIGVTRATLEAIGLLPVGTLMLMIAYYAVARVVAQSRATALLTTVFVCYYYPGLYNQFATQTYAWTHTLFLCELILIWHWVHQRKVIYSVLVMLLFTVTFLHYHTTPIWILSILGAVALGGAVAARKVGSWSLAAFCAVLFFSFDTVVYGNGLARIVSDSTSESFLQSLVTKVLSPLVRRAPALRPFEIAPFNSPAATWSTLVVLLLLTVPVGLWCLAMVYQAARSADVRRAIGEPADLFVWSIITAACVHLAMYSLYGAVSIRVIQVAFPVLLPLVVRKLRHGRRIEVGLAAALAGAAVVGFAAFAPALTPSTVASETGVAARLIRAYGKVLGDANTYGALLLNASEERKVIDFTWVTSQEYLAVVGAAQGAHAPFDYLAVEHSGRPVIAANWVSLEPWDNHFRRISQNPALDKVYDSENLSLFQPATTALSAYQPAGEDLAPAPRPGAPEGALLALACALLLLPGLALLLALRILGAGLPDDRVVTLALAIGLSIAVITVAGYVANFSGLTLAWLLPLVALLPAAALAASLLVRRPRPALERGPLIFGVGLVVLLAAWAGLAGAVQEARAEAHAEYTELFVTQSARTPGGLAVHVVSRLSQPHAFQVVYVVDGVERARSQVATPARHTLWTTEWAPELRRPGERAELILERDGEVYRALSLAQPAAHGGVR